MPSLFDMFLYYDLTSNVTRRLFLDTLITFFNFREKIFCVCDLTMGGNPHTLIEIFEVWQFAELTTWRPGWPYLCICGFRWNFNVLGNFLTGPQRLYDLVILNFFHFFIALLTKVMFVIVGSFWSFL